MDEIDRILTQEPIVTPSAAFSDRVMREVRDAAATPPPIEFPWHRFLPGMLTSLTLVLATFMVLGWSDAEAPAPPDPQALLAALQTPVGTGLLLAGAALVGSLAIVAVLLRNPRAGSASL